jgi:hypothetical protein
MAISPHVCAVLAGDSKFFHQSRGAIESIRRAGGDDVDVRLITIGPYPREQLDWLAQAGVTTFDRTGEIPRFADGPPASLALSCRPFLPQLFPEADGFVWIDSDIRILSPAGLAPWIAQAGDPQCPVAAAQESEPAYCINAQPTFARNYHRLVHQRLRTVYGEQVAQYLEYYKLFNAGLFAMPARSPIWKLYRANLERALSFPYDRMREQDALNVAIAEVGARAMPSTLNWLCSLAMPVRGPAGRWLTPDGTGRVIDVAHLTNSGDQVTYQGRSLSYFELYREMGLTT